MNIHQLKCTYAYSCSAVVCTRCNLQLFSSFFVCGGGGDGGGGGGRGGGGGEEGGRELNECNGTPVNRMITQCMELSKPDKNSHCLPLSG